MSIFVPGVEVGVLWEEAAAVLVVAVLHPARRRPRHRHHPQRGVLRQRHLQDGDEVVEVFGDAERKTCDKLVVTWLTTGIWWRKSARFLYMPSGGMF